MSDCTECGRRFHEEGEEAGKDGSCIYCDQEALIASKMGAAGEMYKALELVLGKIQRNPFSGDHKIEGWTPRDSEIVHKAMYKAEGK